MTVKKILIIEDNDMLSEEISDVFVFEGYQTFSAKNGKIGLELAKKHLPDLIICDILMPEMDGIETLNQLRSDPSTCLIPFIYITALSERCNIRSGMELGADDYIPKPFTRLELLNSVNARLAKSEMIEKKLMQREEE